MANIWDEFDKQFDTAALAAEVSEAAQNGGGSFEKLDPGVYEVKVDKIEFQKSKKDDPMVHIRFKVVQGKCKGKCIYMYQVINRGFQIHIVNEMLRSLTDEIEIRFDSFKQYNTLLMDVMELIDEVFELE